MIDSRFIVFEPSVVNSVADLVEKINKNLWSVEKTMMKYEKTRNPMDAGPSIKGRGRDEKYFVYLSLI